ncbi:hypothetical protein FF38_11947, partial [Lucilia cuprina]
MEAFPHLATSTPTWADLKCRTKQNIAENNKSILGTGGGPCHIKSLTPLELQIDKICNLSSAAAPKGPVHGIKPSTPNSISSEIILTQTDSPFPSNSITLLTTSHFTTQISNKKKNLAKEKKTLSRQ